MQRQCGANALDHLYKSVFLLASEMGRVEDRLAKAYYTHILRINEDDLPASARSKLGKIRSTLKVMFPAVGEVNGVDREEAINLAMAIILLYDELNP